MSWIPCCTCNYVGFVFLYVSYYDLSYLQEHIDDDVLFLGFALKDETGQYIAQYQVDKDTLHFIMTDDNEVYKGKNTI